MPPNPSISPGKGGSLSLKLGEFLKTQRAVAQRNINDVEKLFLDEARKLVGQPGPTPSRPGQPPKRQSGRLQRGIVAQKDLARLTLEFRSTAPHSGFLENGTRRMAARPFMKPTWQRLRPRVAAIMQRRK